MQGMKGYQRGTISSEAKHQGFTRPVPWYLRGGAVENANKLRRARMQNGNRANGSALKPQWVLNEEKEVERVRQNKLKHERDAASKKKALAKNFFSESIRIANRLQKGKNNIIALKKLEMIEKQRNAALKARYDAENEAEYARQNELNRERREEWKKKAQTAARNEALRNATSRANRARSEALEAAWWASQNARSRNVRRNVRPAATMQLARRNTPQLARRNAPLPVVEGELNFYKGELNFYKRKFVKHLERMELVRLVFVELKDQFKIFRLEILPHLVDAPSTPSTPLLQQPTYVLNEKLRRKWMRRKKNVFMQKRANAENVRVAKFATLRSEAARANFNALSKQLVVARQSRALPRDVVSIIKSMERIQQSIQRARTPQQQRSAMHKIAPFVRAASHLAPILGLALGLAAEVFIIKTRATTVNEVFASHSRLDVMRMLVMLTLTIAPLLVFMFFRKNGMH